MEASPRETLDCFSLLEMQCSCLPTCDVDKCGCASTHPDRLSLVTEKIGIFLVAHVEEHLLSCAAAPETF